MRRWWRRRRGGRDLERGCKSGRKARKEKNRWNRVHHSRKPVSRKRKLRLRAYWNTSILKPQNVKAKRKKKKGATIMLPRFDKPCTYHCRAELSRAIFHNYPLQLAFKTFIPFSQCKIQLQQSARYISSKYIHSMPRAPHLFPSFIPRSTPTLMNRNTISTVHVLRKSAQVARHCLRTKIGKAFVNYAHQAIFSDPSPAHPSIHPSTPFSILGSHSE